MKSFYVMILLSVCVSHLHAQQKRNQIGIRLGDPIGITYKRFLSEKAALQFGVGTAYSQWNPNYYRESFDHYYHHDEDYEYDYHTTKDVLYLNARYVIHNKLVWDKVPGKFEWYWGIGVLGKTATINYEYLHYYTIENVRTPYYEEAKIKDYDLGPESIIGIQYTFDKIPLSVNFDVSLLIEFHDRLIAARGFSALCFFYNF